MQKYEVQSIYERRRCMEHRSATEKIDLQIGLRRVRCDHEKEDRPSSDVNRYSHGKELT